MIDKQQVKFRFTGRVRGYNCYSGRFHKGCADFSCELQGIFSELSVLTVIQVHLKTELHTVIAICEL